MRDRNTKSTSMLSRSARALVLVAAVISMLALSAGHASGQDDPYGGTTTTTRPAAPRPSCTLRTTSGAPGSTARVTVRAAPRGMSVRLLFDGQQVAQATAQGPGTSPRVNFDMSFTVPDVEPGEHEVTALGTDFAVRCTGPAGRGFEVRGSAEVLSADRSRGGVGVGPFSLARTGVYVALLLAIAVALLLIGWVLLRRARRRQEAERQALAASRRHRAAAGGLLEGDDLHAAHAPNAK